MSARYEVSAAGSTSAYVVGPGTEEADVLELGSGESALVIGDPGASAYAVTGTPAELRLFLARLSDALSNLPE
jgi:hypothetical protein